MPDTALHETAAPEISVILPAFNVAGHIGAAIASLQAQSWTDFEALVIDDGSTDDTAANAAAAIGTDLRFRLIRQQNRGLSGARNAGLDLARGRYVAFLDGDDRFAPAFLASLRAVLEDTGGDWIASAIAFCPPDGALHPHSAIHGDTVPADPPLVRAYDLTSWEAIIPHFPSAWNKLYRRGFIGSLRFDDGLWFEDHGFFQSLAARARTLHHLPVPLYLQTVERDGQITRTDSDKVFDQFEILDRCAAIMAASGKPGVQTGLARLATRLMHERLSTIRAPDRTRRFMDRAARFFSSHALAPDWHWDRYLPAFRSAGLAKGATLCVAIDATANRPDTAEQIAKTLARLQTLPAGSVRAVVVVPPGAPAADLASVVHRFAFCQSAHVPSTWPDARFALTLPLGAEPDIEALQGAIESLVASGAGLGVFALRPADASLRDALPDGLGPAAVPLTPALAISLRPAAFGLIISQLDAKAILHPERAFDRERALLQLALPSATTALWLPGLAVEAGPNAPRATGLRDVMGALHLIAAQTNGLTMPPGWRRRLFLRAADETLDWFALAGSDLRTRRRQSFWLAKAVLVAARHGILFETGEIDPPRNPKLRLFFRLPPSDARPA